MLDVLALLLVHTAAPAVESIVPRAEVRVVVRMEGRPDLEASQLRAALDAARDIWRPYVDLAFTASDAAPGDRLPPGTLELIVTDRMRAEMDTDSLGWIAFEDGRPLPVITVSAMAARTFMAATSWSGRSLSSLPPAGRAKFLVHAIGRSIAHEVGHYLLATKTHAAKGLMRAHVTADDIMSVRRGKEPLDATEVARLNQGLATLAAALR